MSRQIKKFSYHAKKRLHERTKLRMSDVKAMFGQNLFHIIGTDEKETHIFHCLIYSNPDNQPYIILLNSKNNIVVSVLYFDYQSWNIDYNLVYDLKYKKEIKKVSQQKNEKYLSVLYLDKKDRVYITIKRLVNTYLESESKAEQRIIKYFLYILSHKYSFPFSCPTDLKINCLKKFILNNLNNDKILFDFFAISHSAKFNLPDLSKEPTDKLINIITSGYPNNKNIVTCISESIFNANMVSSFKKLAFNNLLLNGYFEEIVKSKNADLQSLLDTLKSHYPENESKLNKIDLSKNLNFSEVNKFNQICDNLLTSKQQNKKPLKGKLIISTLKSKVSFNISGEQNNIEDYFYIDFLNSKKSNLLNINKDNVKSVIYVDNLKEEIKII